MFEKSWPGPYTLKRRRQVELIPNPSYTLHKYSEASLPTAELESRPAVKKAWEQFQIVAGLSNSTKILKDEF